MFHLVTSIFEFLDKEIVLKISKNWFNPGLKLTLLLLRVAIVKKNNLVRSERAFWLWRIAFTDEAVPLNIMCGPSQLGESQQRMDQWAEEMVHGDEVISWNNNKMLTIENTKML